MLARVFEIVPQQACDYGVRVEITDHMGRVIPGFSISECDPIHEDSVRHRVTWNGNEDVSALAGQPIRLRFHMCFASLYAFQFRSRGDQPA